MSEIIPGTIVQNVTYGNGLDDPLKDVELMMWWLNTADTPLKPMNKETKFKPSRGRRRMRWLDGITDSMDGEAWHGAGHRVAEKSDTTERLTLTLTLILILIPLLLPPSVFPSIRVFSNESVLRLRWPKYWSFSFSISPYNEYSRLISFRMDWLDVLVVQRTLKSLLQHRSSKASILQC